MTMTRVIALTAGLSALVGTAAFADENRWGTVEQLKPCADDKAFKDRNTWSTTINLSADCKAEVERRVQVCVKDPEIIKKVNNPNLGQGKPEWGNEWCHEDVYRAMHQQADKFAKQQEEAKQAEADKAKVAAQRMPKADMHNAQIEKSIANTFHQAFPDHKIIKVIITDKSWDYEKDAFGHVTGRDINASVVNKHPDGTCEIYSEMWVQQGNGKSYKGPFEERGAGSLEKVPILCENAK